MSLSDLTISLRQIVHLMSTTSNTQVVSRLKPHEVVLSWCLIIFLTLPTILCHIAVLFTAIVVHGTVHSFTQFYDEHEWGYYFQKSQNLQNLLPTVFEGGVRRQAFRRLLPDCWFNNGSLCPDACRMSCARASLPARGTPDSPSR